MNASATLPDHLLAAAGRGDHEAFGVFFDLTVPLIFALLHNGLSDRRKASEATERIYVRLWRTAPRFRPGRQCAYALLFAATRRELGAAR